MQKITLPLLEASSTGWTAFRTIPFKKKDGSYIIMRASYTVLEGVKGIHEGVVLTLAPLEPTTVCPTSRETRRGFDETNALKGSNMHVHDGR